ncbi:MAG: ChrR family anti-sigma-E factor [Alphaproteobacteria bacterium]|nr:ChrR family anti-sigma-E factor [Alphaproteobacteria bacterium]
MSVSTAIPPGSMPSHHPDEALLLDYAAGALGEAESLAVATHLALCPDCRHEVADLESVGGAMLEEIEPAPLSGDSRAAVMARLDEAPPATPRRRPVPVAPGVAGLPLPEPLRSYLGETGPSWRRIMAGVAEHQILAGPDGYRAVLLRIEPEIAMPVHTHRDREHTLVLAGGFTDAFGHFLRGDFSSTDPSVTHQPVADPGEPCICLAITTAPLRLTGRWARFLNPFLR